MKRYGIIAMLTSVRLPGSKLPGRWGCAQRAERPRSLLRGFRPRINVRE